MEYGTGFKRLKNNRDLNTSTKFTRNLSPDVIVALSVGELFHFGSAPAPSVALYPVVRKLLLKKKF